MTLDEILGSLFPAGHSVSRGAHGTINGTGRLEGFGEIALVGIVDHTPLSVDGAILLSGSVLDVVKKGGETPILVLVDTASQNMTRRDELLGLNEYLGHLAKSLLLAAASGHRTIGVLYGHAAAGALISTALATQYLAALPGAEPSVMDLPSISRVTKLSLDKLQELAKSTPVFAPGLDPIFAVGAVTAKWDAKQPLSGQLAAVLRSPANSSDERGKLGLERKGRMLAAQIANQVEKKALARA
ncbi:MAG TPA: biotin-independent malonate decarboxylase subunit gamma [Bradyrhizobium sp.]|nr:biotin-independent malonate decarboxylase subunit gamma [Bradyrhizobium sp.]